MVLGLALGKWEVVWLGVASPLQRASYPKPALGPGLWVASGAGGGRSVLSGASAPFCLTLSVRHNMLALGTCMSVPVA